MSSDEVTLDVEGTKIMCKKRVLIENSDYFKAMLEGNFKEKDQDVIKIKGVTVQAINNILFLLWDYSCFVKNEDLLTVLQGATMLQFLKIKEICAERLTEILSPNNCLSIWQATEPLEVQPLCLKAKSMALEEFLTIKDTDYLLTFKLDEIYYYLGHINLNTDNEFSVFETVMKWWYENGTEYIENQNKSLLKLLSCIDYKNLSESSIKEAMTYPDITDNSTIMDVLSCIRFLKSGKSIGDFTDICQGIAQRLYESKSRILAEFPCMVIGPRDPEYIANVYNDAYKRKRMYEVLGEGVSSLLIVYYEKESFQKLVAINKKKFQDWDEYKIAGYKEFIFIYGGRLLIENAKCNHNFWVYDTIRERWERKTVMPFERNFFETCLVGSNVFIIGGSAELQMYYEDMFWYNYKFDQWSDKIRLPCSTIDLKCCSFLNQLLLVSLVNKRAYSFSVETSEFMKMEIIVDDDDVDSNNNFSMFSYKDNLYVKGKKLIKFVVKDKKIVAESTKPIIDVDFVKIQTVLCNNIIYTFYTFRVDGNNDTFSLETYNLNTDVLEFIFKNKQHNEIINIEGVEFELGTLTNFFTLHFYKFVDGHNLINFNFM